MKSIKLVAGALCVLAASTAFAQTVDGTGTPGRVPVFKGPNTVGDSAVYQSNGNIGIGTTTPEGTLHVINPNDAYTPTGLQPYAVIGTSESTINFAAAIRGDSDPTTGDGSGVIGVTNSPGGSGILGLRTANSGTGGAGITGTTQSTTGFSFGARGTASGGTGYSVGVFGEAFSPAGYAALFSSHGGGNILVGTQGSYSNSRNVFRVDGAGRVFANGGFRPFGADFAESVAVSGDRDGYAAGDLLVIDDAADRHLSLSQRAYSSRVAGIYSTQPGVLGSTHAADEDAPAQEVPLAVIGIVPCKVTTENGAIQAGDLLVSSSLPGHAMHGTDRKRMMGAVVGKALQPLEKGTGVIEVLVTLQ